MNKGYAAILTGYVGWGLLPLYWALLIHVPALEILLHRMLWSVPLLLLLVLASPSRRLQVQQAFRAWGELRWLALSALILCLNWGVFIWAVTNHRVVEASMGYFLTPLLNVLAGVIVFKERLSRPTIIAILFAACGVSWYVFSTAVLPWVSLLLGGSFAVYGLLRKKMSANAVPGLFIETLLLLPLTLAAMLWLHARGQALFLNHLPLTDLWLILGGPITVLPLALFAAGTRLLPMSTVGILFYVTPSLQFLTGVLLLGEVLNLDKLAAFVAIWIGLAIFSYNLLRRPAAQPL